MNYRLIIYYLKLAYRFLIQKINFNSIMDIKCGIKIKSEFFESLDDKSYDHHVGQVSNLEDIQDRNCYANIDIKREIEVKNRFRVKEEDPTNEPFEQSSSVLYDYQTLVVNASEEGKDSKVKRTSRTGSQLVPKHEQKISEINCQNNNKFYKFNFGSNNELKTQFKRKFKCFHCSYETNFKADLNRHLPVHGNIKLFKCSECNYECNYKQTLNSHMLKHEIFKCAMCSFKCNRNIKLKRHILSHRNSFKCSQCSYETNLRENLKSHMHNHEKMHHYSYEGNNNISNKRLTHSLQRKNITPLFKCSQCCFECDNKRRLKRQLLSHVLTVAMNVNVMKKES